MSPFLGPVRQALREAHAVLAHDPDGSLPLPQRRAVWLAMGRPYRDKSDSPCGLGWRRRVRLGLLTVQHLLPLWELAFPEDTGPHQMLFLAQQVFAGAADPETANAEAVSYWNEVADLGATEDPAAPPDTAFLVGPAAACVMQTVCSDAQVLFLEAPAGPHWEEKDTDMDAWLWDESYLGAMAAAGGDVWDREASRARRRAFWLWWLGYAVPQACKPRVK